MRSFDIALKNIKKSRGDYSVYFFTLILGVAIFYMFNAVGTQGIKLMKEDLVERAVLAREKEETPLEHREVQIDLNKVRTGTRGGKGSKRF